MTKGRAAQRARILQRAILHITDCQEELEKAAVFKLKRWQDDIIEALSFLGHAEEILQKLE